ncbi:MAG: 5-dehydro-4-deoxy-D-glucuronate isomerase [Sphingobacteriales bacterium]|nr:MAG: 5-dehydro-4-deoxy-D-glucuronate isomerase [Sphingobacteriales bacterium]
METRFERSQKEVSRMTTDELRGAFLIEKLMQDDKLTTVYSHYDRLIVGGAKPVNGSIALANHPELRAEYFLERRELGIINVGGKGSVTADGQVYVLEKMSCLYLGKGTKEVNFASNDANNPAGYYLLSSPAHKEYPNQLMTKEEASPVQLGDTTTSNSRTIYKYIHLEGIRSCQLVMGLTVLQPGSVWNSVPPHTHTRRTEVYFYFDLPGDQRLFHFMGEPTQLKSITMANHDAVVSPPWSVHFGCGTSSYTFIWGMAGENQQYTDMDALKVTDLK